MGTGGQLPLRIAGEVKGLEGRTKQHVRLMGLWWDPLCGRRAGRGFRLRLVGAGAKLSACALLWKRRNIGIFLPLSPKARPEETRSCSVCVCDTHVP